ncbi:MAG: DUF4126 domain-containing protein [Planctomycetota bacterium]
MELVYQIMMGVSLSACAGFRAWVPLLVMGIMARTGHIQLNSSMQFLASDPMLVIFGLASVLEFCGDKFIAVDHFLDVVGTVARPIAGTILVASMITKMDGHTTLLLGLMAGGGTAMTMHAGKAVLRTKSTALAMFHGGAGNAALSIGEDILSGSLSLLAVFFPYIAFLCAMMMMAVAVLVIFLGYYAAKKVHAKFFGKPAIARTATSALPAEVQS